MLKILHVTGLFRKLQYKVLRYGYGTVISRRR